MVCSAFTTQLAHHVACAAHDKLATNPVLVDVSERLGLTEGFIVASAPTVRQVKAIAEEIMDVIAEKEHLRPVHIEGRTEGTWVLLDYGEIVIHVLKDEEREYYALEKLWGDCPVYSMQDPSRGDVISLPSYSPKGMTYALHM
ncbi:ribosome silencing factor [Schaalia sp. lx-260]|uniref:ribosome silencing factor n=1 Tax=Schaalia sp. lx-260 TaxID=2899082 RepID=UPI001E47EA37|nr:ribosome silencing factor [Schaalia sp. lx-260]MCD4549199.1 ribosome silencing factor [Schaalia sp. lx-260]